jgi:hypothetical protein
MTRMGILSMRASLYGKEVLGQPVLFCHIPKASSASEVINFSEAYRTKRAASAKVLLLFILNMIF